MIPVLLAIRDPLCRHGLRGVLESAGDLHVVGMLDTPAPLPHALAAHAPCVVVLDVAFQLEDPALAPRLAAGWPGTRLVLFAHEDTPRDDPRYLMAVKAGASASLDRRMPVEALREGVLHAAAGLASHGGGHALTPRELEIAAAVAEGLDNRGIAARLRLREQTVKNHVSRIMGKLGTHSRVQLARWALEQGHYSP